MDNHVALTRAAETSGFVGRAVIRQRSSAQAVQSMPNMKSNQNRMLMFVKNIIGKYVKKKTAPSSNIALSLDASGGKKF